MICKAEYSKIGYNGEMVLTKYDIKEFESTKPEKETTFHVISRNNTESGTNKLAVYSELTKNPSRNKGNNIDVDNLSHIHLKTRNTKLSTIQPRDIQLDNSSQRYYNKDTQHYKVCDNSKTEYSSINSTSTTLNSIEVSSSIGNSGIEMKRKYFVKVSPINTKYIAVVRTITNSTPLLLCFDHGRDKTPREIINLKSSFIYRGVTERGPCICLRSKGEYHHKAALSSAKVVDNPLSNINDDISFFNSNLESNNSYGCSNIVNSNSNKSNIEKIPNVMYEIECHNDFIAWCNFFSSIGLPLGNFRSLFHTTKLIGEGSFAKVYKGRNVITGEDIVIKAVDKKKVKESNVYTEIEVLRKVHHPHIVHLIASFEEDDHVCLVLEFLGGGELFEWIAQKGAYTEEQAKVAMRRILLALQWLHTNDFVHRDLKTENLILENKDCPESLKIIDFGLAASLGSPAMKMRCGSPGYVAPEILEDKSYNTKVDVFSIGVVLYTVLGGSPPFPGNNMKEILKRNIQGNIQFSNSSKWKSISSCVKDLIKWMMAKDPDVRCTAAQAIYHPWFEKIPLQSKFLKDIGNVLSTNKVQKFSQVSHQINVNPVKVIGAKANESINCRTASIQTEKVCVKPPSRSLVSQYSNSSPKFNINPYSVLPSNLTCDISKLNSGIQNLATEGKERCTIQGSCPITYNSISRDQDIKLDSLNTLDYSDRYKDVTSMYNHGHNEYEHEKKSELKTILSNKCINKNIKVSSKYSHKVLNRGDYLISDETNVIPTLCCDLIDDKEISYEHPSLVHNISNGKSSKNSGKSSKSNAIRAVFQSVFGRFSNGNCNQIPHMKINRKYEIN
ncbi:protein kinase domain-containing protein [Cryptosporidium muris RN66]|uniref:Protein kinase domain-containing protein n=1 Tax=Cryptosporidium muris (strain RN66) TaxID=441375 RepID=B6ABK9_CRYMR|nr:protein kinase domain-containing protein [Cryptosporidium muris RN66]EEA05761.1 protein kinase domain-containing protein [Cryptosporidium muris RN66]|eukprot:XP_002140110.1 protein kinase domain-containing protein [Cryptosporidium muris RN66]